MEYYCNIYCNPRQDYFIKVDQLFQNESNEGKGVYNFTGLGSELLFWIFSVIRDFQKSEEKIWLIKHEIEELITTDTELQYTLTDTSELLFTKFNERTLISESLAVICDRNIRIL